MNTRYRSPYGRRRSCISSPSASTWEKVRSGSGLLSMSMKTTFAPGASRACSPSGKRSVLDFGTGDHQSAANAAEKRPPRGSREYATWVQLPVPQAISNMSRSRMIGLIFHQWPQEPFHLPVAGIVHVRVVIRYPVPVVFSHFPDDIVEWHVGLYAPPLRTPCTPHPRSP